MVIDFRGGGEGSRRHELVDYYGEVSRKSGRRFSNNGLKLTNRKIK